MREALDQMLFVNAAFGLTVVGTALLVGLSFAAMRRAEERRDKAKKK
ncbi:hypothetical protein OZN62_03410 [Aurantiacibacter sp. MUD11]|nr:hypothetical protein [Aurantiacibacter sp. MUD11]WAT18642.1 hypothetical protein OZN62_03410 [Aurantiacibacter sp. MUD11]